MTANLYILPLLRHVDLAVIRSLGNRVGLASPVQLATLSDRDHLWRHADFGAQAALQNRVSHFRYLPSLIVGNILTQTWLYTFIKFFLNFFCSVCRKTETITFREWHGPTGWIKPQLVGDPFVRSREKTQI